VIAVESSPAASNSEAVLDAGVIHLCEEDAVRRHFHVFEHICAVRPRPNGERPALPAGRGLIGTMIESCRVTVRPRSLSRGSTRLSR